MPTMWTILPTLLTMSLFLGPLLQWSLETILHRYSSSRTHPFSLTWTYMASPLRVYVLGPFSEEFVFRGCMIPTLVQAGYSVQTIVWGAPILFGVAHVHHAIEHVRAGKDIGQALQLVSMYLIIQSIFKIIFLTSC